MLFRDGQYVGSTPMTFTDLRRGEDVSLELTAAGFLPLRYLHHVTSDRPERVTLRLEPSP
jgi:hypothetical protein